MHWFLTAVVGALPVGDWPTLFGPHADNSYRGPALDTEWGADGPPVVWEYDVGPGFGGAAVRGGEVFLLDRVTSEADVLRCLSLESGEERWSLSYESPGRLSYAGSRSVPTVTEEHVYTVGAFGLVHCISRGTHESVWSIDQNELFNEERPYYGWCQSPVVFEELVIIAPLGESVGLVALDQETGETVWTSVGIGQGHSTPVLVDMHGRPQVLIVSAVVTNEERSKGQSPEESREAARSNRGGLISSFDPRTGERLWSSFAPACTSPVAAPLRVDDTRVFVTGGYRAGSVLLRVTEQEGVWTVTEEFRHPAGSSVHPAVLWEEHLFLTVNENYNEPRRLWETGGLMCLSLEGEERWRTGGEPHFGRGPYLVADGLLILQDGHDGVLRVVEATDEAYRQRAEADLFTDERRREARMWAPMALSEGRLLIRSQDVLLCVDLRSAD